MQGHHDAAGLRHRDDALEEVLDVGPQALLTELAVGADEVAHLVLGVAGVPAGQVDVVLERVKALHLVPVHDKARGAVFGDLVQLRARPVKDGHEVVGHALDAVLGAAADGLAVVVDMAVTLRAAQLDLLGDGDGLHHVEDEALLGALIDQVLDGLLRPDLAGLDVVDGGDDGTDAGNLTDHVQGDGIAVAVPTE